MQALACMFGGVPSYVLASGSGTCGGTAAAANVLDRCRELSQSRAPGWLTGLLPQPRCAGAKVAIAGVTPEWGL